MSQLSEPGMGVVTVLMTAPGTNVAEQVVRCLVEERLIACGNIIPDAVSIYRWERQIQREKEVIVVMKTVRSAVAETVKRATELHPYDVPELLVQEVTGGAPAYLDWVRAQCHHVRGHDGE